MSDVDFATALRHPSSLSPTAMRAYDECPRRYAFAYLENREVEDRPSPHLIFANAIHGALADLFRMAPDDRDEAIAHQLLRHHWMRQRGRKAAFLTTEEEGGWGFDALGAVSRFCNERPEELEVRPLAVEDWIRAPLDHGHIVGGILDRADRIEVPQQGHAEGDGQAAEPLRGLRVTDYKTGRCHFDGPDDLAEDRGAQIYAVGATRTYRIPVLEVRFLYLRENTQVVWKPEREDLAATEERLAADIDGIHADQEFEARADHHCRWCSSREICPAQQLKPEDFEEDAGTVF